jgi:flagellin-like protein
MENLKMDKRAVSPVVGTILLIAITVALAAIVATLVSGLGGRGAPPSAMLTVKAENAGATSIEILLSHEGGDDLNLNDITLSATDSSDGHMQNILGKTLITSDNTLTLSVGDTATATYSVGSGIGVGSTITVYVIHGPSKQKIFSSSSIVVQQAGSF